MIITSRISLPASLLLLTAATTSTGYGFAEIARGALLLQTTGSVTYDSYFLGTVDNDPDTIYTLFPSLQYSRHAGRAQLQTSAGIAFNRHQTNTQFDSDDIRASGSISLPTVPGSRLNGLLSLSYTESTTPDLNVYDRVASETFNAAFNLNYQLSSRMDLIESLSYSDSTRSIYSDQQSFSNRIAFSYKDFLRGTSLNASHSFTNTQSSGDNFLGIAIDQNSHDFRLGLSRPLYGEVIGSIDYGYSILDRSSGETSQGEDTRRSSSISLGINGPFLPRNYFPKLTSSASLSYSQSATAGINDDADKFLSGHISLSWAARERTTFNVGASRSMQLTVADLSVESTRVNAGFNQGIGLATRLSGSVGYSWRTYRGVDREDSTLDGDLGLSRTFNKYLSAALTYGYQDNNNDEVGVQLPQERFRPRNYERHTLTGAITVTF